jgi:hypothetical protein
MRLVDRDATCFVDCNAGAAMSELAVSYSKLGRHEEALAMQERVLEFRRRVLPENHPDIGEGHMRRGVACGLLTVMRLVSLIVTRRRGDEQSCFDLLQTRKARGSACDEGACAGV